MPNRTESLFDRRVVERNIKYGKVTKKEFEQYLTSLTDARAKATSLVEPVRPAVDDVGEDEDEDDDGDKG